MGQRSGRGSGAGPGATGLRVGQDDQRRSSRPQRGQPGPTPPPAGPETLKSGDWKRGLWSWGGQTEARAVHKAGHGDPWVQTQVLLGQGQEVLGGTLGMLVSLTACTGQHWPPWVDTLFWTQEKGGSDHWSRRRKDRGKKERTQGTSNLGAETRGSPAGPPGARSPRAAGRTSWCAGSALHSRQGPGHSEHLEILPRPPLWGRCLGLGLGRGTVRCGPKKAGTPWPPRGVNARRTASSGSGGGPVSSLVTG